MIPPLEWKLRVPGCKPCVAENEKTLIATPAWPKMCHAINVLPDMRVRDASNNVPSQKPARSNTAIRIGGMAIIHQQASAEQLGLVASSDLEAFLRFCSESNVYAKPEQVKMPVSGGPPVQLLADPVKCVACMALPKYTYYIKDKEIMQKHSRKSMQLAFLGRSSIILTLFSIFSVGNTYFNISQNPVSVIKPNLKATLQFKFFTGHNILLVIPPNIE
ncbi:hypothetical protein BDR04DRAFT_1117533 [Suillus decipiens]|nr:hypothetical protein BDR04DRAFT_1117533 [Suillus decipiens]